MTTYLGIDLGTTYTAAAVHDGVPGRAAEVVTLGERGPTVPSVLYLQPDGGWLAGDPAERHAVTDPERIARQFKRRLGDPTPLLLGSVSVPAEVLTGHLLRWVVDEAVRLRGERPAAIVLTHPANWGPYKRDLLDAAADGAGVGGAIRLSEPRAAAISYSAQARVEPGAVVAVYDLGGGTFDAAVLRKEGDGGFTVLGMPDGIEHLGGIDVDAALFSRVVESVGEAYEQLDPDDPQARAAVARLRVECTQAKEALSQDSEITIPVLLPTAQTEVRITRRQLEAMIRPTLAETVTALERAVRSTDLAPADIDHVLLVGGSSRIPLVAELVSSGLGRPVAVDAHPKHAVALGAALVAAREAGALAPASSGWPPVSPAGERDRRPPPPPGGLAGAVAIPVAGAAAARPAPPPLMPTPAPPPLFPTDDGGFSAPPPPPPAPPAPGAGAPVTTTTPASAPGLGPPPPPPTPPGATHNPAGAATTAPPPPPGPPGATAPGPTNRPVTGPATTAPPGPASAAAAGPGQAGPPPPPPPPPVADRRPPPPAGYAGTAGPPGFAPDPARDLPPGYMSAADRAAKERRDRRRAHVSLLAGALALVAAVGATVWLKTHHDQPDTVASIDIGDCFTGRPGDLTPVDCGQAHQGELFGIVAAGHPHAAYPGKAEVATEASTACVRMFRDYYGGDTATGRAHGVDHATVSPSAHQWAEGATDSYCVAVPTQTPTTTGSIRGQGRP